MDDHFTNDSNQNAKFHLKTDSLKIQ